MSLKKVPHTAISLPTHKLGTPLKLVFRISEAAAAIGVSRATLYALIRRGTLRTKPLGVRRGQIVTAASLIAYLDD